MSSVHTEPSLTPMPEIRGYRLLRALNHGGMSTVFLAEQLSPPRQVAVKVMAPHALSDEVSRRRFENEVRTIARLEHPHVVSIHELGRTTGGLPYYAMPYLPRGHLGQRSFLLPDGTADEKRVVAVLRDLLSALRYAHSRGVVHRDVKAENVLFDDTERPLLADFGVALRRGYGPRVTAAGLAVGSTAYMAPEQARGEEVDGRADLYSLGVLAWEMLTGELPFRAADALSMAVMHAQDPIPRLPPGLRHWQRFMNHALAKVPVDRFTDAAEMEAKLARVERRRRWPRLAAMAERGGTRLRTVPRMAWGVPLLAALVVTGVLLANGRDAGGFLVAGAPGNPLQLSPDPIEAMLQPLREAPVQLALEQARQQMRARDLTTPAGANAHDSVLRAWEAEPGNPQVVAVAGELAGLLGAELLASLDRGSNERAIDYAGRIDRLHGLTGGPGEDGSRLWRQAGDRLAARIDSAASNADPAAAGRAVELARELALPQDLIDGLATKASRVPRRGQPLPGDPAGAVVADGGIAISRRPVSRAEYARFVSETGRESGRCRLRGSVLRVLSPRDWRDPGFGQDEDEPVVCISLDDAQAYGQWYSGHTGHRYRLPTTADARSLAPEISGRPLSLWLADCGSDCQQRRVSGSSWRSDEAERLLDSGRGYDDVGFRLVREL
ncbi:bifunctional serine/threonine-protein kinase/formylglycine-generating enzyme family protein [Lysobacter sp. GX 14042]|uniref:bifunctional serine/threonine-protein kinase/formylglycine-generating enzyme family protein n=1 Tax=Lysobacter sp. GX 14042 TaxID=2907155 RepID=UPI001F20F3B7|nr:bifunctional serine/threonine-protein kinase/formylglycine-generating enzyme family protein [Lysobacter sp. GX 14042]MCE7033135.1 bifunctional serine/threonine-protein kinase/formylglycine-generating enzyme family protein [Lysobacter sp. GX 14042]